MANFLPNVACVIDINPAKQNTFIPHTATPILSPENAFLKHKIDAVLVTNPNYFNEVKETLKVLGEENLPVELL